MTGILTCGRLLWLTLKGSKEVKARCRPGSRNGGFTIYKPETDTKLTYHLAPVIHFFEIRGASFDSVQFSSSKRKEKRKSANTLDTCTFLGSKNNNFLTFHKKKRRKRKYLHFGHGGRQVK